MAKQTKYNYRGRPQGSYMSYRAELEILDDTPPHKQKSFFANLARRLREHGIDPFEDQSQRPFTRATNVKIITVWRWMRSVRRSSAYGVFPGERGLP